MKSSVELKKKEFCDKLKCIVGACEHKPTSTSCLYWKLIDKGEDALYKYIVKEFNKTVRSLEYVSDAADKPVVKRTKATTNSKTKRESTSRTTGTTDKTKRVAKTRAKVSKTTNKKVKGDERL